MRKLVMLSVLGSLSACQLAPEHVRPLIPADPVYPVEYAEAGDAVPDARPEWQAFFADPQLATLIDIALTNNRDLEVAALRIEEARATYGIQRADRLPTITATADATRYRTSLAASATAAGVYESYSLDLGVSSFELDFWGRVRNLSAAARSNYLATVEAAQAFQLSLTRELALAYLSKQEAAERIDLAVRTVSARRDQLRIAERRLDAGVTSELEFRQAETLLTQAEAELAGLRLNFAQSNNLLSVLLGGPHDKELPASLPLGQQVLAVRFSPGLPSDLLESRPDIRAAEQQLIAARANVGAARAAFFPAIKLTGSFGYSSTELDTLVGEDGRAWSFMPSISLPIFDTGRRRAALDVAQARENIAVAGYERVIQTAFREVADALAGRRFLAEQIAAQERGIVAQRRLAELARQRYNEGVVRYLEVLDAERNLFAAEQALLQVRRIDVANNIALFIALGGNVPDAS